MTRTFRIVVAFLCAALIGGATIPLAAQAAPTAPKGPGEVTVTEAPPSDTDQETDSGETREKLRAILVRYPPEVGRVLKLDSTLLRNETWLATYPALKSFIAAHPEIAHSPAFFLDRISIPSEGPTETGSLRVWNNMIEAFQIFATTALVLGVFIWIIRTLIEHRRWSRTARIQAEVHTKLMDRLASNEELLAYIQTPPGKRFLESAPIQLDSAPRSVSAPVSRILWSVQVGLVLASAGIGLQLISMVVDKEVTAPMFALGALAISIGAGFVLSAFVSFVLSRKFGLLETAAPRTSSGE